MAPSVHPIALDALHIGHDSMPTRLEESLERDIERIRQQLLAMAALAERALRDSVAALVDGDRQRAHVVVLRDQYIDEKEKEIDRLCLEFLLRQQPVGVHLRLAYSAVKINLELERVGDYAESIARHVLRLTAVGSPPAALIARIVEMADLAIPMVRDSIDAFIRQEAEQAKRVMEAESTVDGMLAKFGTDVVADVSQQRLPPEMMEPLITIARRLERVADQARNVCMETIYMCTGEVAKHPFAETFRVLFIGEHNACRSQMAEAIAQALGQSKFIFSSAGLDPRPIDAQTLAFMREKGFDLSRAAPKAIFQVPNLDHYQVIVGVAQEARQAFPRTPRKMVYLDWALEDPSRVQGSPDVAREAYEKTFQALSANVRDLVGAVLGVEID
jgi:phosphate transport system protein